MREINILALSGILFMLGIYILSCITPANATSATTLPNPPSNLGLMAVGLILIGLSMGTFTFLFIPHSNKHLIIGVIPERMASSRFPGKPLALINGTPMVEHVWRNAKKCRMLNEVYVCSPDTEILRHIESVGGKTVLTRNFNRASDQVAYAVERLELFGNKYNYIVMIQGDEPMITPEMIDSALQPLLEGQATVSNLMFPITPKEASDRNSIKVVTDINKYALYFSRQPIPDGKGAILYHKQVCVIPFTRDALFKFTSLQQTPLEQAESVDMMRLLENGIKVKMVPTLIETHSVDVPSDIKIVERMMKK